MGFLLAKREESLHEKEVSRLKCNQITDRKGAAHRLEMTVVGMKNGRGQLIGVLASFRDVTDLLDRRSARSQANSFAVLVGGHSRKKKKLRRC